VDPRERDSAQPTAPDTAAAIHEATNALTVILGWIERAKEACRGDNSEALDALGRAARYARAARDSMRRSIGAEVQEHPPESGEMLAHRVVEDLAVEARTADVTLECQVDPRWGPRAVMEADIAWQVLTNLLLNALAASPRGGRVRLEVSGERGALRFRVSDEGSGIDPEVRDSIFEAGVSKRQGGTGIGLWHARSLAEDRGGTLDISDVRTLRGASFELRWPASYSRPSNDAPPSSRPPPRGGLEGARVLLLEDDSAVTELLELSLATRGARVTSVTTAAGLTAALAAGVFDILLIDLSPVGDQLDETLAQARSRNPGVHVVLISGSVAVDPRPGVLWVRKPFEPRELVAAIVRERAR
jgi:CheY-like chemotaxis protein